MNNNKLIAEFMGVKPIGGSTEYEMYGVLDCIEDGVDEQHFFLEEQLLFHTSWDWLMPVVAKCTELNDDEFDNEGIAWALLSNSIVDAYDHVLCFIQEYNLTPKEVV